ALAFASLSLLPIPTKTHIPGPILPTISFATLTWASATLWITTRTTRLGTTPCGFFGRRESGVRRVPKNNFHRLLFLLTEKLNRDNSSNEMWATIIHAGITLNPHRTSIQCQDQETQRRRARLWQVLHSPISFGRSSWKLAHS